jgi:hypothetical protein
LLGNLFSSQGIRNPFYSLIEDRRVKRLNNQSCSAVNLSKDARRNGNLKRPAVRKRTSIMSKPTKTEAELIVMARGKLKVHVDCPDEIVISVLRTGDSWEFRTSADEATVAKPGYPECVAMIVQIGDHLSKQFDLKG